MKIVILTGPLGSGKTTTLPFVFDELEGNKQKSMTFGMKF
jgi:G3E family GTPase